MLFLDTSHGQGSLEKEIEISVGLTKLKKDKNIKYLPLRFPNLPTTLLNTAKLAHAVLGYRALQRHYGS